jgi:hypothetical protein
VQRRLIILTSFFALLLTLGLGLQNPNFATLIGGYSVNVVSLKPGTGVTNAGKAIGQAETSVDVAFPALAVRKDTQTALASATGDYTALETNALNAQYVQTTPNTTGGLLVARDINVGNTNSGLTVIKNSPGQLYSIEMANTTASTTEYVKIYNAPCASVTIGTTTPVLTLPIFGSTKQSINFSSLGVAFSSGICATDVTTVADTGTTAPAANAIVANFFYD